MGRRKKNDSLTLEERQEKMKKSLAEIDKSIHRKEVSYEQENCVAMANNMIVHSASNLSLNELKLLRFIIMQSERKEKELFSFDVNVIQLAEVMDMSCETLYRELDGMTTHLMQEVIKIGTTNNKDKWKKFHWVDVCEYDNGIVTIKLSDELKPYLLGLEKNFTMYRLSEIVSFNSVYAIRIYEMLHSCLNHDLDMNLLPHADLATEVSFSIDDIRRATDTEDKLERYSNFKAKVIDTAIREINLKSPYHVIATPYKRGRAVQGFDFLIESQAGYIHRTKDTNKDIKIKMSEDDLDGQMNLMDYQTSDNNFEITKG